MRVGLQKEESSAYQLAFVTFVIPLALLGAPVNDARAQASHSFDLQVAQGRLISGPPTVLVKRGDTVELRWTSDSSTTVHLHGYDLQVTVSPLSTASMRFQAHATGRFPVETHAASGRHVTLLYVEVHPR